MNIDDKFKSIRPEWKVFSDTDIFQLHNVITELINIMTEGQPKM